ncbi:MAG: hypothetical protein K6G42_03635 [Lachnospiraceae bacterium]|nr:hypothetical protein [Lachnospiraceae bacterium]
MREKKTTECVLKALLFFCTVFAAAVISANDHAFAATCSDQTDGAAEAFDAAGHVVGFDGDHHTRCAGPVRFVFNMDKLVPGEIYAFDDGSVLNPVENGEYILNCGSEGTEGYMSGPGTGDTGETIPGPGSEAAEGAIPGPGSEAAGGAIPASGSEATGGTIPASGSEAAGGTTSGSGAENMGVVFYKVNAEGEMTRLHGGVYQADIVDGIYDVPEAVLNEEDGKYTLKVSPLPYSHVFCEIRGHKNGSVEEVTEDTEFIIDEEGEYSIYVYGEDGMGHRTYADIPSRLVLDRTPPVIDEPEELPRISQAPLHIELKAYDELSGLEGIYIECNGLESVAADEIDILPPFKGRIDYFATDRSGNSTGKRCLCEELIVDDRPPVISVDDAEISEDQLELTVSAADDTAGVGKVMISTGSRALYQGSGKKERVKIDISDMPYGMRTYTVSAADAAGNETSSQFTVEKRDGKAPGLNFSGVTDKGVYGKDVTLSVTAEDDSDEKCHISGTVSRYDLAGEHLKDTELHTDTGEYKEIFDNSGVYIVKAEASDLAGNRTLRSIAFAIDKEAPVIKGLPGLNGSTLKSFMMQVGDEIAEDSSMVQVKVMLNGMDYDGSEVTKSGRYRLQIIAMDEFGNNAEDSAGFEIRK